MVKGVNKQMIVLRIEGNKFYESACFVLKNEITQSRETGKDMLDEANRLLGEMDIKKVRTKKKRGVLRFLAWLSVFLLGAIIGFCISLAL